MFKEPFTIHPMTDKEPHSFFHKGELIAAQTIYIGEGEKILGEVKMQTKSHGYDHISDVNEQNQVAALWMAAPALYNALKDLVEQDEANRPDGPLLDCDAAYKALNLVKTALKEDFSNG